MNLKTTIVLLVLAAAGAACWFWIPGSKSTSAKSATSEFLEKELTDSKLNRIEVQRGSSPRFVLEKSGQEWSLPGKWPVRPVEVKQYVAALTGLRSRFTPIEIKGEGDLKRFGLTDNALTISLKAGGQDVTLTLGEDPDDSQRFNRPTYLRLGNNMEVLRLGPGLVAALDRPAEYFQQRRLFPVENVAKDADGQDKVEQLAADNVRVQGQDTSFEIVKTDKAGGWEMKEPVRDHVDPNRLKALLVGFADLWAERFIDKKDKKLDEFGLKDPEITLTVDRPNGATSTLQIGKVSRRDSRIVLVPPPPNPQGFPQKPFPKEVTEEYRYAKLRDNDQIFEIKADKLKDIAVRLGNLRDAQLARFKTGEVERLSIEHGGQTLVLVKEKDNWKFEKPAALEAESGPVREILDKLSDLQARDSDVLDKADLKTLGLEKPLAVVRVSLEEETAEKDMKTKAKREIVFRFGLKEQEKTKEKTKEKDTDKAKKLYVAVDGWPRVNAVDDSLLKLVERPAIAYRNRKITDVAVADLSKIEIQRGDKNFTLEKDKDNWRLGKAELEKTKVEGLVRDLAKLEAVDLVSDHPKDEDLDKLYGLAKPALSAKLFFADSKKTPQNLTIGKQREGKQEYFARMDSGPIFAVRKSLHDDLDRDALTYRALDLWKHADKDITELAIHKDGHDFRLKKDGLSWKITGPFEATATPFEAENMVRDVAELKAVKFVASEPKDVMSYGLDKPALKLTVQANGTKPASHTLFVGKEAEGKTRFAKLEGGDAIFTVDEKNVTSFDRTAFDLLDPTLLILEPSSLEKLHGAGATSFTLEKKNGGWQVTESPAPPFIPEDEMMQGLLGALYNLRGSKVVAYGPKIQWSEFGLDKPAHSLTVTTSKPPDKEKSAKTTEHVISIGKEKEKGQRYARLDKEDRVVLLDPPASKALVRTYLDFVNPRVLKFDLDAVTGIARLMNGADVELVKRDDNWRMTKPTDRAADEPTAGDILEKTFRLKAVRIADYPAKNLEKFGLDKPAAIITLKLNDGDHVIKVGAACQDDSKKETGERYALVDKGESVIVLPAELSRHLVAPVLYFADRNLPGFTSADMAILERGSRKLTFKHSGPSWQMTEPVKVDAEDAELEKLLKGVRRLRVEEIVADKGADLKLFGLDQPEARWRFLSGDREVLSLLIGKEKNDRRYGKLGNSDLVFVLGPDLSKLTLEEFRSRKPWPALDAAQVESLKVSGPISFSLNKNEGGKWTLSTDVGAIVDSKKVSDTLDAIADLRALRYVADHKADLKLYGLEPPVWTVELQMPTGKRTLYLGRAEGDSKRLYATVPGSDAVFVVDDAAASRMLRPAIGYLEEKKK
ncbi:MAG: DUF4340 domain-containing protein [Planctomycetes bacterium]|nr:DUF4340 domain-containing protein [Planctomycetota bacterium]